MLFQRGESGQRFLLLVTLPQLGCFLEPISPLVDDMAYLPSLLQEFQGNKTAVAVPGKSLSTKNGYPPCLSYFL